MMWMSDQTRPTINCPRQLCRLAAVLGATAVITALSTSMAWAASPPSPTPPPSPPAINWSKPATGSPHTLTFQPPPPPQRTCHYDPTSQRYRCH